MPGQPPTLNLNLSDGSTVTVRKLPWAGYKEFKALVAKVLQGQMLQELLSSLRDPVKAVAEHWEGEVVEKSAANMLDLAQVALTHGSESIGQAVRLVLETSDEFTRLCVHYCVGGVQGSIDEYAAEDVSLILEKVLELNDFGAILEREKNLLVQAATTINRWLGNSTTTGLGGSQSNPS